MDLIAEATTAKSIERHQNIYAHAVCRRAAKEEIEPFKGATKLYFTHYIRVVIILFNTSLYKSAISTYACENFSVTINFYEKQ